MSKPTTEEQLLLLQEESRWVVDMFDQANTNRAVESVNRGKHLKVSVEDLRSVLTDQGVDVIFPKSPHPKPSEAYTLILEVAKAHQELQNTENLTENLECAERLTQTLSKVYALFDIPEIKTGYQVE